MKGVKGAGLVYGVLQVWSAAGIECCRYGVLQVWSAAGMECCRYGVLQV